MRTKLMLLVVALALCFCGCESKTYHPPPVVNDVNVKLLDSNASSVTLQFDVYVRGFSKKKDGYNLKAEVLLSSSRITLQERETGINDTSGTHVYKFNFSFDRDRSYIVSFKIMKNNSVYDTYPIRITNLQSVPNLEFGVKLKDVDFQLVNLTKDKATLFTKLYFTSSKIVSNVSLHLKAKPVGTSLIATEKWIDDINFTNGLNVLTTNLTVPRDYNYLLVIEAWRGDKIEKTWREPLILNPEKPKPKNETQTNFSLQNFVVRPMPRPRPVYTPPVKKVPSFLAVTTIVCLALLAARRLRSV